VGVDLGGADGAVAEKGLDASDVGAVLKKIGGETVAKNVGSDLFENTGFDGIFFYHSLN